MEPTPPGEPRTSADSNTWEPGTEAAETGKGKFGSASVRTADAPPEVAPYSLHAREPLNRGIRSYLLYLVGSPRNLVGRLLLKAGANTDEALVKAARDGHWQIIPELLDNLSNPRETVRQAIYTAVIARQAEMIVHLHRLSGVELEEDYYWQLVEKLTHQKKELSDEETAVLASLFLILSEDQREELRRSRPECHSDIFSQRLTLFALEASNAFPLPNRAVAVILTGIEKQFQLGTSDITPEEQPKIIEFLMKYGDEGLLNQWFGMTYVDFILPEQFIMYQASDAQLLSLFRALKHHFTVRSSVSTDISNLNILPPLLYRFPDSIDLKIAVLHQVDKSARHHLAEEIYTLSLQAGNHQDCALMLKGHFLSPSSLTEKAIELSKHNIPDIRCYSEVLTLLPLDHFDAQRIRSVQFTDSAKNDPFQKKREIIYLCIYANKLMKVDRAQATQLLAKWVKQLLDDGDYFALDELASDLSADNCHFLNALNEDSLKAFYSAYLGDWDFRLAFAGECYKTLPDNTSAYVEKMWRVDPLLMTEAIFYRSPTNSIMHMHPSKADQIKLFTKSNHVEELLTLLEPEALAVMQSDPDLASIPVDSELVKSGSLAACYANLFSAKNFVERAQLGKSIACALLFANKCYPRFNDRADKDPVVYPPFYALEAKDSKLKRLFHYQVSSYCYEPICFLSTLVTDIKNNADSELLHPWLDCLRGIPKDRMDWVFNTFIDTFEGLKAQLPPEEQIRCNWLAGCFEYIRVNIGSDLVSLALRKYLDQPVENWPDQASLAGEAKQRMQRLRYWRQSPFCPQQAEADDREQTP